MEVNTGKNSLQSQTQEQLVPEPSRERTWQFRLHEIIYESNTTAGQVFDICLLLLILGSIGIVMIDSVASWHAKYGDILFILEWVFTIIFTIEYLLRLICIKRPWLYITSLLGMIDLIAILPTYLSLLVAGTQSLLVIRSLRLLRIFRIFKLTHFLSEIQFLTAALKGSLKKISIFMLAVLTLVIILGSIMYLVEKGENGFTSIPSSIYWAIVTITTVGYGDISPATGTGKLIASVIMLIGYGIIAVPTGIITTEVAMAARKREKKPEACPVCGREGHDKDAGYCKYCGGRL